MATGQNPPMVRNFTQSDGVALREYMETRSDLERCYLEARFSAIKEATELAAKVLEEQRTGMNVRTESLAREIDELKSFRDRLDGKASQQSVTLAQLLGLGGLTLGIIGLLLDLF